MKRSFLKYFKPSLMAFVVVAAFTGTATAATAPDLDPGEGNGSSSFYGSEKDGYYWYKDPKEAEEREEDENKPEAPKIWIPKLADYSETELMMMHPAEFTALHNAFFDKALMNPTEASVYEYMYVLDIANKKSSRLASATEMVTRKYGRFDRRADAPYVIAGKRAVTNSRDSDMGKWFEETADQFAVLFFTKDNCFLCDGLVKHVEILKGLITYEVKTVHVETSGDLLKNLGITDVPSIVLIKRDSNEVFTVARSADYAKDIRRSIYRAARYMSGLTTPGSFSDYEYEKHN